MRSGLSILVAEPSSVVFTGISALLENSGLEFQIKPVASLPEIQRALMLRNESIVILNPSVILNHVKEFSALKNEYPEARFVAFVYSFFDSVIISMFDAVLTITDTPGKIVSVIREVSSTKRENEEPGEILLSERETEVLKYIALGLSNKEIAVKLNISINTVITHRKNISQKTSIRSVSGLTIYAVVNKLINIDSTL